VTAPTAAAPAAPTATRAPRLNGRGIVRAEWLKLRTLRSNWLLVGLAALAILALGPLISLANGYSAQGDSDPTTLTQISLVGLTLAQLLLAVFAVLSATNEYATGLIRASLTANPRRPVLFAAKTAVTGAIVLVLGVVGAVISFQISMAVDRSSTYASAAPSLATPGVARGVVFAGLYLMLLALIAHGFGWLLRSTAGAIASVFGLLLVLPVILAVVPVQLLHDIGQWLPAQAMSDMESPSRDAQAHTAVVAMLVMIGYAAASLAAGAARLLRSDA
jgi:hypothetical protein